MNWNLKIHHKYHATKMIMWIAITIYAIFIFKKKWLIYTFLKENEIKAHMIECQQQIAWTDIASIILKKRDSTNENAEYLDNTQNHHSKELWIIEISSI